MPQHRHATGHKIRFGLPRLSDGSLRRTIEALESRQLFSAAPLSSVSPQTAAPGLAISEITIPDGQQTLQASIVQAGSGYDVEFSRFNSNGTLDTSFANHGVAITPDPQAYSYASFFDAVAIQPDGKILLGGPVTDTGYGGFLARYNANGTADSTFGSDGFLQMPAGTGVGAIAVQPNGDIVASSVDGGNEINFSNSTVTTRLNSDGSVDTTFGDQGSVVTTWNNLTTPGAIAIGSDGSIYVAAATGLSPRYPSSWAESLDAVQYNSSGQTIQSSQTAVEDYDLPTGMTITADGDLLIAGVSQQGWSSTSQIYNNLVRLDSDLQPDATFGNDGVLQYFAGAPTFNVGLDQELALNAPAQSVQNWATLVSAGPAGSAGTQLNYLMSTDAPSLFTTPPSISIDGTLSYQVAPGAIGTAVVTVELQDLGQGLTSAPQTFEINISASPGSPPAPIVVNTTTAVGAAVTSTFDATSDTNIISLTVARYESDGMLDPTFGADGEVNILPGAGLTSVTSAIVEPNGKILIAGDESNGGFLVQLNGNGTLDTTFNGSGYLPLPSFTVVSAVAVQTDGKILASDSGGVARFNTDGTPDDSFGTQGVAGGLGGNVADALALASNGNIYIADAGQVHELNSSGQSIAVSTFLLPQNSATSLMIEPDGDVVATYAGLSVNGSQPVYIARYTANLQLDPTFGTQGVLTYQNPGGSAGLPAFSGGPNLVVPENSGPQAISAWATITNGYVPGIQGANLNYSVATSNPGFFSSLPTISLDGTLNYAVAPSVAGTVEVTVTLHDAQVASLTQTFFITAGPSPWQNQALPQDVDGDGSVTPTDALIIINYLNLHGSGSLGAVPNPPNPPPDYLDVNGDGSITPDDALSVIDYLNTHPVSAASVAVAQVTPQATVATASDPPDAAITSAPSSSIIIPAVSGPANTAVLALAAPATNAAITILPSALTANSQAPLPSSGIQASSNPNGIPQNVPISTRPTVTAQVTATPAQRKSSVTDLAFEDWFGADDSVGRR